MEGVLKENKAKDGNKSFMGITMKQGTSLFRRNSSKNFTYRTVEIFQRSSLNRAH